MPGDPHYVQHYRDHSEARRAPEREPHREGAKKVETEVFGRKTTTYVDDGKEGVGGATYDAVIANQASTGRSSFRFLRVAQLTWPALSDGTGCGVACAGGGEFRQHAVPPRVHCVRPFAGLPGVRCLL